LEKQFTSHDLCEDNQETLLALLEDVDKKPSGEIRPRDPVKLIQLLKLRKACGIDGIPNECLKHLPRRPLEYLRTLIIFHIFPKERKNDSIAKTRYGS
jgi:hypothetical protein